MRKKVGNLLTYKKLLKVLGRKRRLGADEVESGLIDKMHRILSKKEPDYDSLFEKIKGQIEEKPDFSKELLYFKPKGLSKGKRTFIRVTFTSAAAIGLLLLAFNFSSQISIFMRGYNKNANPEIVAKISQVYDRNKAILIINDSLKIGLSHDTAIFEVANGLRDELKNENGLQQEFIAHSEEPVKMNTLVIPKGNEFLVTLPDGSEVFLNSNAKFTFPSRFEGDKREVFLEGEGMFKVAKTGTPFQVVSANSVTTVLGTVFNIKSKGNTDEVTLCSGSVEVSNSTGTDSRLLIPEQQAAVSNSEIIIEKVDLKEIMAWTEGKYYFRNIPLEEIAVKLYDWYDVEFQFADENIKMVPFTGMLNRNSSLKTIFELFEMSYNLHFTVSDSSIVISNIYSLDND